MATTTDFKAMNVYEKLHYVQSEIGWVEKLGKNTMQKYDYVTEPDIFSKVNPLLKKARLAFAYSVKNAISVENETIKKSGETVKTTLTRVFIEVTVTNIDNPTEQIIVGGVGDGADLQDKGVFKAMTGASKYIMLKLFMMPAGDEPEQETPPSEVFTEYMEKLDDTNTIDDLTKLGEIAKTDFAEKGATKAEIGEFRNCLNKKWKVAKKLETK